MSLDKEVEIVVVGRRCVYINDYRVAGAKPYWSENLPQHSLKTTLGEILNAFPPGVIRKALTERRIKQAGITLSKESHP